MAWLKLLHPGKPHNKLVPSLYLVVRTVPVPYLCVPYLILPALNVYTLL